MSQNSVQKYNKTFNTLLHLQTALGLCEHREPPYDKGNQYMITVVARGRGGGPDRSPQGAPQHRKIDGTKRSALGCFENVTKQCSEVQQNIQHTTTLTNCFWSL
jgi:hypothetical protein